MSWIDNLRSMKTASGLSTREIANISSLPEPTLEKLFAGQTKNPGINTIQQLVHALGHTLDDLDDKTQGIKKEAPSDLSEEALMVATDYANLDERGKGAVRAVLSFEVGAATPQEEPEKKVLISLPKAKHRRDGFVEIKVYDQPAAAGLGNYLDDPDYHMEQYPEAVIHPDTDFGIIISGDSMEPKVHDGGTVFVQATPSIDPGKIGIFVLNGLSYCKKLVVDRENRQIRLASINRAYDDIVITEFDEFRTIGRVLGQWTRGFRQDLFGW